MTSNPISFEGTLKYITLALGAATLGIVIYALTGYEEVDLHARLLPAHMRRTIPWKTIKQEDVLYGRTVPPHTHVIIHVPEVVGTMNLDRFFGNFGERVRYWGYVIPENYQQALRMRRRGLPGRIFLSKKERTIRAEQQQLRVQNAVSRDVLQNEDWLNRNVTIRGRIRHQTSVLRGGMTLYIQAEEPLPVGLDPDNDMLIDPLEREYGTDPMLADSDYDGLLDGIEVYLSETGPTIRDSDSDGLIDGIEDKNLNGHIDPGETNPLKVDSDNDGLPDGVQRFGQGGTELRGEDVDLDGEVDPGETDPLNPDSDGDGILDEQEYFNCVLQTEADCKYSAFPIQ